MSKSAKISLEALKLHKQLRGKLKIEPKRKLTKLTDLHLIYTPGVGSVSEYVAKRPKEARNYTSLNNTVAVVSDGSAVLGLGNLGAVGALPVMEGKAVLFKEFAGLDAWPIVLGTQDPAEIVKAVQAIAPSFGAINLEDIGAPQCFEIEAQLKASLDMPVMHDDQHGTAIVVLAGLINAAKVVGKKMDDMKIVLVGSGAAGNAITKLLALYSRAEILVVDSIGILSKSRKDLDKYKKELLKITNPRDIIGDMHAALAGADVMIGVSKANLINRADVRQMAAKAIIFAMANPNPEILPAEAKAGGAAVIATGRSDFPNQINNALAFPGIFRGALDNQVKQITDTHKVRAAEAIAALVPKPTANKIIPSLFDKRLVPAVAKVIR